MASVVSALRSTSPWRAMQGGVLAGLLLASACATTTSADAPTSQARAYYPAVVGAHWTYRASVGPDIPLDVTVLRRDERGAFVDSQGGTLTPRNDGLFDGQRFLLEDPLTVGHTWSAKPRGGALERFEIVAVGVDVDVPAGHFEDCVVVKATTASQDPSTGAPVELAMIWTWARGVGFVRLEQQVMQGARGSATPTTTAVIELTSFERPAAP